MNKEVLEKLNALIIAAFGLVAALAWNTAIQEIFKRMFGTASGLFAMIFYAVIVTVIAVWVTMRMAKLTERANKISEKAENMTTKLKTEVANQAENMTHKLKTEVATKIIPKIKKR